MYIYIYILHKYILEVYIYKCIYICVFNVFINIFIIYLGITFASGYIAGVACAIVSHPADTVVSKMSKGGKTAGQVLSELGPMGIWGGLGTRILMIGTLTGLQWWIYDSFKTAIGLGIQPVKK
jgi:solute carrier family 25 phosphate transporter 3